MSAIYAQSGGPTAVINVSAVAVIREWRKRSRNKLYACKNGIIGLLNDDLEDTSSLSPQELNSIESKPGAHFGSCRYKVKSEDENHILKQLKKYKIRYVFYNGGNDSADTTAKLCALCKKNNYEIHCIGVPKTIDNDLVQTDVCPGFGSAAKFISTSLMNATHDVKSMCKTSTKVFIMEVMGRHAGWLCAAGDAIDTFRESRLCLFPEIQFSKKDFLEKVDEMVKKTGFCVVVASEGIKDEQTGDFVSRTEEKDAFGHYKLGNVGIQIGKMIGSELGYKTHVSIPDYLQRASAHHRSRRDQIVAKMVGTAAVQFAFAGMSGVLPMVHIKGVDMDIRAVPVDKVANQERTLPLSFIENRYNITKEAQSYILFWMD